MNDPNDVPERKRQRTHLLGESSVRWRKLSLNYPGNGTNQKPLNLQNQSELGRNQSEEGSRQKRECEYKRKIKSDTAP